MNGPRSIKKSERNNPVKKSIRVIKDKQAAAAVKDERDREDAENWAFWLNAWGD